MKESLAEIGKLRNELLKMSVIRSPSMVNDICDLPSSSLEDDKMSQSTQLISAMSLDKLSFNEINTKSQDFLKSSYDSAIDSSILSKLHW
jgi:hypothetical protein